MHRPVLVTAASVLPVTLEAVKLAMRVDVDPAADADIESLIKSAVSHYEGWSGVLGIALVAQTWRQDFDSFGKCMRLPVGPVQAISSVKWRDEAGQLATVADSSYALQTDAGGRSVLRFRDSYSFPSGLYETGAVSVEYLTGWPVVEDIPTTPEDIKTAIKLRVQLNYDEAAQSNSANLERIEDALVYKYRKPL